MVTVIKIEKDRTSPGCGCTEMWRVVEKDEATQKIVRVLGSGIKNYIVATNIKDVAERTRR